MKIIIIGDGDTGVHLARQLSHEEQDVILMGTNPTRLNEVDSRYNILTIEGESVSPSALRRAGVTGADLCVAVTPWGNDNLIIAQLSKALKAAMTVARIDNAELLTPRMETFMQGLGVDKVVYPEHLAAREIRDSLNYAWLRKRYSLHKDKVEILSVTLNADAPLNGVLLKDFNKDELQTHVAAIRRCGRVIIPSGNDMLQAGDTVFFTRVTRVPEDSGLRHKCGKIEHQIKRVMIAGAGKMTAALLPLITNDIQVTVIDPNEKFCARIASNFGNVNTVCADFRNLEVLREEGIADMDTFIALTDYSETNIVSCLVARQAGVFKTVAEIEDLQYLTESDALNIDTVINKKLLTSSTIYQLILQTMLTTPRCLMLDDEIEVAEIIVSSDSKVVGRPVRNLKLPRGITLGALIRNDIGMLIDGNTKLQPADHIVVFYLSGSLPHIERIFR